MRLCCYEVTNTNYTCIDTQTRPHSLIHTHIHTHTHTHTHTHARAHMQVDKKVQRMYARVKKHLGNSNLAYRVWERLYEQLVER